MASGKNNWIVDIERRVHSSENEDLGKIAPNSSDTDKTPTVVDVECGGVSSSAVNNVKAWMAHIESRVHENNILLSEQKHWKNASIYHVPGFARGLNPEAFSPELVSFGPFHYDHGELKLMEVHKERALVHFVKRSGKPLKVIVDAVESIVQLLHDAYYRLDDEPRSGGDGFLKLMVTDGCFMLEVLRYAANIIDTVGYSSDDPVFSHHGVHHKMPYIRRDMLLIENQLPLLLLKALLPFARIPEVPEDIDGYIHKLVLMFMTGEDVSVETVGLRHHTLDVFRLSLLRLQKPSTTKKQPVDTSKAGIIRCAVELNEAGVRFRKSNTKSLRDISFDKRRGILYLPELMVDDATECTFLNIIAFEHLHFNIDHDVTSYICFMDEIIDSSKDVILLHTKGIIQNSLGSDKAVAGLFNRISKEVTVDPENELVEVRQMVNKYCQKKRNQWRAALCHTYFNTPWSIISLVAALLVIALTIVQTVFTILQLYSGQGNQEQAPAPK